jgi:hypothetical protein
MDNAADLLMLRGVVRHCPDCRDDQMFVPVEDCDGGACEFCCTTCGAAILVDATFDAARVVTQAS